MIYYAIKHKPSETLFPTFVGGQRRGSTHIDWPFKGPPRLFTTKQAANNCLRWWLGGPAKLEYDTEDDMGNGSYVIGASPGKGDPTREADAMEILEVNIG